MEKLIYTAMSGAQHTLMAQQIRANNLANVNTAGFRADFERASAYALTGDGYQSRVMAREEQAGTDFRAGALMQTGRKLDVAIRGDGFLTVQTADGKEAYTRAGNLEMCIRDRLSPMLGTGNFRVQIAADVNFNAVEETQQQLDPNAVVTRESNKSDKTIDALALGIPGALSNRPPETAPKTDQAATEGNAAQEPAKNDTRTERQEVSRQYESSRTIVHTRCV